jgi:methylated-DNA-[protein]-cysteine S-methyltransferase
MNELQSLVPSADAVERALVVNDRFRARAEESGAVDVAVSTTGSPVGELLLVVTPRGLLHVGFANEDRELEMRRIAQTISPRLVRAIHATDSVRRELDEYFAGRRTAFSVHLDRRLMSSFARQVLAATSKVPFGSVATYGEIATRIHRPGAARAVGAALGSNPIPIIVPCHRVVGAGGALTGYGGGLERKTYLLHLEQQPTLGMFG